MADRLPYTAMDLVPVLGDTGLSEIAEAIANVVYRRLRDDVIAEVRAEVQRVGVNEATTALSAAIKRIAPPIVQVAAPTVQTEVLPADVTVNVPKGDPPKVTVTEKEPKHISIVRDADGRITGANVT